MMNRWPRQPACRGARGARTTQLSHLAVIVALVGCANQSPDKSAATQPQEATDVHGAQRPSMPASPATSASAPLPATSANAPLPATAANAPSPATSASAPAANAPLVAIANARQYEGILVGGAPTDENLQEFAKAGYRTVIDLRAPSEPGVEVQQARVKELNMSSVSIPVAGALGLTRENIDKLDEALSKQPGPVVVHCASGNRVGALLALRAFWIQGKSADEALAVGKASGMTSLEPEVKRIVGR